MYSQGEYVAYGMTGVCIVEGLTEMAIPGTKDMKSYYVLKPVYEEKGVIYCPVSNENNMRGVGRRTFLFLCPRHCRYLQIRQSV